ncbi:MAG TPA: MDR family MFS transporter [Dehalococcoidia bacterium]|nr:MDR family MFS transporter [Dehalococcoidia bacterium]
MQDLPLRQKLIIMVGVMLGLFFSALLQTSVTTATPHIVASLGGLDLFSWVFTIYILTSTVSIPIFGKLSDIYGRKLLYLASLVVFIAGSAMAGAAQDMPQLIAFRAIQGLGAGGISAIAFTIVGDIFAPQERGRWEGIVAGTFGVSSVVGPLVGGYIADNWSWRWVFYINLPVGVFAFGVIWAVLPQVKGIARGSIDYLGTASLVGSVSPLLLALLWGGTEYPWSSPVIIGLFVASAAILIVFVMTQARVEEPILPLELFANGLFSVSMVATFLTGAAMFALTAYLPLFVQAVIGLSATNSGLVVMPLMIGLVTGAIISGAVMTRTGRYKFLLVGGTAILTVGLYLTSRMDADASQAEAVRNMVICGIGIGPTAPLFLIIVQNALPHRYLGVATSSVQFFRQMGGTIGVAVMGTVLNNRIASELDGALPPAVREANAPPLRDALEQPELLLNDGAATQVGQMFAQFGDDASTLFDQSIEALRVSLANSLETVFLIGLGAAALSFITTVILREIPLRTTEEIMEELRAEGAAPEVAGPAVPAEGGAEPTPS